MKVWGRRTSLPVVFEGHTGWVGRIWYRRDGRRVVTAPIGGYEVKGEYTKGWDPSTGELDPALTGIEPGKRGDEYLPPSSFPNWARPQPVTSPDGKLLARVGAGESSRPMTNRSKEYANNSVVVLDAATGLVLHSLIGHTAEVVGLAFSPDGRRIATASFDRTLKLWDTATGREVFTLRGPTGWLALAFSPDGRRIVSGGIDYTARVWDATPLPAEVLQAQYTHYRQKREAFGELVRTTEDTQRAENLARNGRWDLSAAAFDQLVEQEPDNFGLRHTHIRSLGEAGDKAGVRRACEDLLTRYGISPDLTKVKDVVWSCVLAPDVVADREAPVRLAESYLALHPEEKGTERSDALRILGAALYRAGRFEEAIRSLVASNQARDDGGDPKGFAFLAMTHHRLGHSDQAKHWLDKLVAYRPKAGADFFWDEVDIRILRREAESLILGSRPPAPSPTASGPTKQATGDQGTKSE
jgi:tetratricopeptide (TPR) repeat protein